MLNIYRSNKIEVITELLAKELIIKPPLITEKLNIAVHNYYLGDWIRDQITISNEISALYDLKTINKYTEELLSNIYPENKMDSWNFESIKWAIINSLEELNKFEESWPLKNWIDKYLDNKKIIDRDIYNLTKKIAKNFVNYLTYRPEMVENWNKYSLKSGPIFNNLNSNELWQPILYKLVENKIGEKPSCSYMMEIINKIKKNKQKLKNVLPKQIHIVSINNLSKLYITFYLKLSEITDINFYILSAGDDLWNRINVEEGEVDFDKKKFWKYGNNLSIEKIFGKFGGDRQKLFDETISNQGTNNTNNSVYVDPTIYFDRKKNISFLNQLQKKLINNKKDDFDINKNDESILLRGFPDPISQLEFIRKQIIKIYQLNKGIKYSDIAIVSPQIKNIKPYLKYIFNNELINGVKIPYFLLQDDYKDNSRVFKLLLDFIEISSKKITIEKIEYLLSQKTMQNIFDFDMNEKDEIIILLNEVGFHWGLDLKERLGEENNSLEWCIKRLILGLVYDEDYMIHDSRLKSFSPKNTSLDLHKWVNILLKITEYINSLRGTNSYKIWVKKIRYILKDFIIFNDKFSSEISDINRIIHNYSTRVNLEVVIDLGVFKEILNTCFNNVVFNTSRYNKILVGEIEKIRFIPHKVIFLMDMNSIYYPQKLHQENINLLNKKYNFGDPSDFDEEKYYFIDLLISCRKKLIISWSNKDNENNKLEISFPIKELLIYFQSFLNFDQRKVLIKDFNNEEKESPNLKNNNKSIRQYSLINKIDWEEDTLDIQNYKLSELIFWFKTPQLYWLNKNNISPKTNFIHHGDDESVSNFQKYKIMSTITQKLEIDSLDIINKLENLDIIDQILNNAIIAPNNGFLTKKNEIKELVDSLALNLNKHKNIERIYIKSNLNKIEYFISENETIELIHTNLNLNQLSQAWIRLLFISSFENKISKTKLIFRKDNQYKTEILVSPGQLESKKILQEYTNIFYNCDKKCFPIPPESSYKYVKAIFNMRNEKKAFLERWVGNNSFSRGERDNSEMQICFGYKKDPNFFLKSKTFNNLSLRIYSPLIEAIK